VTTDPKPKPELIRYAFGRSSLGRFIAAASDKGLVVFEFGENEADLLALLTARLSEAKFEHDDFGLQDTLRKLVRVVEHPEENAGIAIDPRGDPYQKQVWGLLQGIPVGETTTYGALAAKLGTRDARGVTEAISLNPVAILIPCHRVVKKDGSISGYRWGVGRKRALLKKGVLSALAPDLS
jgi:AraC family transcriptional regulator of adaptative response/methylated-DNA-[protein]-cysteine methyltransferase